MKNELPEGWEIKKLSELAHIVMGQSPPSNSYNNKKMGLPFFQGKKEFGEVSPITVKWCNNPKKIAEKGDILMSVRAPVGSTNIASERCCIGRGLSAIKAKENVLQDYIKLFLKLKEQELSFEGRGTTFNSITKDDLYNFQIPFPYPNDNKKSVNIQKMIVSKLDKFFENYKVLKDEKEKANKGYENILKSSVIKLIKYQEETPKNWNDGNVGDFIEILYGKGLPKRNRDTGKFPVYGSNGIVDYHKEYYVKENTIIIGRKGSVGELNLTSTPCFPIDTTYYTKIKEGVALDLEFLFYLLKGLDLKSLEKSTAIPGINRNDIYSLSMKFPKEISEQKRLLKEIKAIIEFQDNISQEKINIQKNIEILPLAVLSKAFKGEL